MALNISKGNIGNALHSVAPDHVVTVANDVFDETRQKYQSAINEELTSEIRGVIISQIIPGKYIPTNTGVGNQMGEETSLVRFNYMRFPVQGSDVVIVNGVGENAPRLWAFIDEDERILSVADANASALDLRIVAPANAKECIINTSDTSHPSVYIPKTSVNGRLYELADGEKNKMIRSRNWAIAGSVEYDDNEIPVSYDIVWADGTAGTVTLSNFDDDVFEYATITATYGTNTIVYALTYDANGYITNETINIQ